MTESMPRWQQIAATLARGFEADRLAPGTRLPTEAQLAQRFDVNRHTIRRAIEALVRTGQVRVEQGRGAFIADDLLDYEIATRTRFSETIRRHNRVPEGRVLRLRTILATPPVAAALAIGEGEPVVLLERLGLADAIPVSLAEHHFPSDRLPGLEAAFRSTASITAALEAAGVVDYLRRSTRVTTRMPTSAEADLLEMPRTRPLLVCENLNVDAADRPIEFTLTRHPGNRMQLVFEP
ncbi:MAG: phosphonate metabolism transcriptional regulator PhnF [Pseudomonadota bacterium]|nr:phosphonate metabolism transcriptional regulator PhnF [Pseudomonadota bacterium]